MKRQTTAFETFHPCVPLAFFALWVCFIMVFFHPVYLTISFLVTALLSSSYFGIKKTAQSLTSVLSFIVLIALVNPLISAQGSTEVCKIGELVVYAESLMYGLFMGVMLVTMLMCLSCANKAVSQEGFMSVCASRFPALTLMFSVASRLVPNLRRKANMISDVQNACTSSNNRTARRFFNMRMFTVLMGWSMEDSLAMADSMKIAGWSNSRKRSTYTLFAFKKRDGLMIVFIITLFTLCCLFAIKDASQFSFYPTFSSLSFSFGYVDFAVFAFLPFVLELV